MASKPRLLRGAKAIGRHLGTSAKQAQHWHEAGLLPTFKLHGSPYATIGALDDWRALRLADVLPQPE